MIILNHIYETSPFIKWERAAWIIVNSKGEFQVVDWLNVPQEGKQFWNDSLPANIVALVHTHPEHLDPRPSEQDKFEAQRLKIFVFTLTRNSIWIVRPDKIVTQIAGSGWSRNANQKCKDELP